MEGGREILETRSLQEDGGPESGWKLCPNPWVTAKRHPCTKRPEGAQQKNRPMGESLPFKDTRALGGTRAFSTLQLCALPNTRTAWVAEG